MKKYLIALPLLMVSLIITSTPRIFIENHYGAPIALKVNDKEIRVANDYNPVLIGYSTSFEHIVPGAVSSLAIRTTGMGSGYGASPYTPLNYVLEQVEQESTINRNKDAVILIKPSSYFSSWNIVVIWRNSNASVSTFTMTSPEEKFLRLTSAQDRLNALAQGILGDDIAAQVKAICNTDYTKSTQMGKVNLCNNLRRNIVKPEFNVDFRLKITQPDLQPTIEEIKDLINQLYRTLQRYMSNRWV